MQNTVRIHNPYRIVVPSKIIELKAKFTKKADKPVFNPIRSWSRFTLLTTRYPAMNPPSATVTTEAISRPNDGISSDHRDFAT